MSGLNGTVALVTGSSSGIGAAVVTAFAELGASVVVNSASSVAEGRRVAAELPDAVYVQADVSDSEGANRLVAAAVERYGRLDIVVNNAGTTAVIPHDDLDGATTDIWERSLRVGHRPPLCSGDMLLHALVACAGVTLRSVATNCDIPVTGTVRAEGDLDFRGTMGVDRIAPVGFAAIRLYFDLNSDASAEELDELIATTERYCVVYQTLAQPAELSVTQSVVPQSRPCASIRRRQGLGLLLEQQNVTYRKRALARLRAQNLDAAFIVGIPLAQQGPTCMSWIQRPG